MKLPYYCYFIEKRKKIQRKNFERNSNLCFVYLCWNIEVYQIHRLCLTNISNGPIYCSSRAFCPYNVALFHLLQSLSQSTQEVILCCHFHLGL